MKKYYKFEINLTDPFLIFLSIFLFIAPMFYKTELLMSLFEINYLIIFVLMIAWLGLHELLHGLAYYLTGTKFKNISFGIALEKGVLYCLTKQETKKKNFIISALTPFIIIGVITYIIACIFELPLLYFLSIINMSGACADLAMVIYVLTIKEEMTYTELDDPTSFAIITTSDLKAKKIGVKLLEDGPYPNDKIEIKDHRQFIISKPSYIILGILLILVLIGGIL